MGTGEKMEKIFKIILIYVPIIGVLSVVYGKNIYKDTQGNVINLLSNNLIFVTSAIVQSVSIFYLIIKTIILKT